MSSQSKKTGKKSKKVSKQSPSFKVGLGIVTYERPDYLDRVLKGVRTHLMGDVDTIWVYDDGSTKHKEEYDRLFADLPSNIKVKRAEKNKGVGPAKNWVMQQLLDEGCYCIFIGEDDIIPISRKAIRGYIDASRETGIAHMMFAHHGPGNVDGFLARIGPVETYRNCVGGWCYFTRPALEAVGLHDEEFKNAYEHVELTWRLMKAGFTTPWPHFADAANSKKWLEEIPGSIENSSIRKTEDWAIKTLQALVYWESKDPDFPLKHTLDNARKDVA